MLALSSDGMVMVWSWCGQGVVIWFGLTLSPHPILVELRHIPLTIYRCTLNHGC